MFTKQHDLNNLTFVNDFATKWRVRTFKKSQPRKNKNFLENVRRTAGFSSKQEIHILLFLVQSGREKSMRNKSLPIDF